MIFRRTIFLMGLLFVLRAGPVSAEGSIVGVVVDYNPRTTEGTSLLTILRNGTSVPVKEHEILYEGDRLSFADAAGPKAYVRVLIDKKKEIVLDPAHNAVPSRRWDFLQSLAPELLSAYRWVNSPAGVDIAESRNAISRGVEGGDSLSVLPNVKGVLTLSADSKDPIWIGWNGGDPPFTVSVAHGANILREIQVCKGETDATCVREAILPIGTMDGNLTLSVSSADGGSWHKEIKRTSIAADDKLVKESELGSLGTFLRATELLDRNANEYVLESARMLATISSTYPPARTLLDNMKSGNVP